MKTMKPRLSTVLSRALLAAFLVSLPGSREAFAQALTKAAASASAASASGSIGSALGGVSMTPGLTTTLSPASLTLTPVSAPSALTPAALAPANGLLPAAAAKPEPVTAKAVLIGAALQSKALNAPALSNGASKSAAAAAFEGGEQKRPAGEVSGVPSALTPRRSAGAAGDLMLPAPPANPTPAQVETMRDALVKTVKPGEAIDAPTIRQIALGAGVPAPQGLLAVEVLAKSSQLIRLSGGVYIFSAAVQRDSSRLQDPMMDQANAKTIDGIDQLNAAGLNSHARALASFGEAMRLLAKVGNEEARAEATILYKNAALELTRDILAEYDRNLAMKPLETNTRETRAIIAGAQSTLSGRYYAAGKPDPTPLSPADQAWLGGLLSKLQPTEESKKGPNGASVSAGWSLIQAFHTGAPLPDDGIKPVPLAERRRSLFPLIEKTDDKYKALNTYGVNVTRSAVEGKLPPMIGRKAEMRQIVKTLLRVEKNNPLIIGEKGVGKTAIANGLAQMIVDGEIPELEGVNVIKLDLTKVVAGTKYRGEFEERMVKILEEARASNGKVRLFIDEIHMLIGAGGASGSADAANILKEALADGTISVIGATTMEEYRKIEKDGALARRFNAVKLNAPTKEEAELIVEGVKGRYEAKHKVTISAETVKAVVAMASRYITDRNLPDSALDLIDDASAEVELKASEAAKAGVTDARREVLPEDIASEVALRTGIPAGKVGAAEKDQLKDLPNDLGKQVVGQAEAVAKVAKGVQRGRMGLRNTKQPIGSFIFLGPTGVGKTEIARQTAKTVFGSEKNMVRLDMSEYMEKHSVSRMIGAPPGYVGFDQAGQLTEAVRRNPYSVILLDEIEKAHPEVLDVLLQVIEDGRLTDGQGRTVDFSNTIIMMTSNIGGSLAGEDQDAPRDENGDPKGTFRGEDGALYRQVSIGFGAKIVKVADADGKLGASVDARRAKYLVALKAKLRPEFINRIGEDGIVVFNELGKPEMEGILALRVKDLEDQLKERGVTVALSAAAKAEILKRAEAQKAYGARPLKQIVERQLSDAIVEAELEGRITEGDAVVIGWDAKKGAFTADKKK
jgi:ATP-dependent Clp protease ATP-binding subunit ClpC